MIIGRTKEIKRLQRTLSAEYSEFVAVYGRRRVGKTFLIKEAFDYKFAFQHSRIAHGNKRMQLEEFTNSLERQGMKSRRKIKSWSDAFFSLEVGLERLPEGKKVVFLDELPWFDSPCSGFTRAFEWFWNSWACLRKDILLIVCGSATTWIVDKVINSRGGLHGRVTVELPLEPFTLNECEQYAAERKFGFDRRQILEGYMALGGVAYYWSLLREGQSMAQNFNRLFFGQSNELRVEFDRVFKSLYRSSALHVDIVKSLGRKKIGLTRDEIVAVLGTQSGGDVSLALRELEQCGFIRYYNMAGKRKYGGLYQLVDPYCIFYFDFLESRKGNDPEHWTRNYNSPEVNTWRGLAFERVALWHVPQIKRAIGISGMQSDVYSWRWVSDEVGVKGVQIDLLIDRADGVVNLCEMKYSLDEYELDKAEDEEIRHRCVVFARKSGVAKSVQPVLITSSGVKEGKYTGNIVCRVTADDFFVDP